jgi:hypothetical protein
MNPPINSSEASAAVIQPHHSGSEASRTQGREVATANAPAVSRSGASTSAIQAVPIGNRGVATEDAPSNPTSGTLGKAARASIKSEMISHLASPNDTSSTEAAKRVDDRATGKFKAIQATANNQGGEAYALSFGVFGLASRAAGLGATFDSGDPRVGTAVGSSMALTMPAVHGAAGALAAPGREETQFIPPNNGAQTRALPDNFAGSAFKPFTKFLGLGNTAIQSGAAAAKFAVNSPVGKELINGAAAMLLFGPGILAGRETARNIYSAKADAGFSLQEPIKNGLHETVGTLVTHQVLSNPAPRPNMEGDWQELGTLNMDKSVTTTNASGQEETHMRTYTMSIIKNDSGDVQLDLANPEGARIPEKTSKTDQLKSALQKSLTWPTAPKIVSLGSAMGQAAIVNLAAPALQSVLEKHMEPDAAALVTSIAKSAVAGAALALHFIPNFQAATSAPSPSNGADVPSVADTASHRARQIADAALPGGSIDVVFFAKNTDPSSVTSLTTESLSGLAAVNLVMLQGMNNIDGNEQHVVTAQSDGSFDVDHVEAMRILNAKLSAAHSPV